ncbi:MAG: hypothetical protein BJ554DRAFT_7971 [Olpidium bornovanus]|uniref:Uncharacterized protein n=1 Tax=Olpidium bornovanus TaxID=278681 RepID=A0A8H7ZVF9_9FUNG|nr:MAG: hypothetical protein BJ554DRAFT_7971 [Olpidium bornovanus]
MNAAGRSSSRVSRNKDATLRPKPVATRRGTVNSREGIATDFEARHSSRARPSTPGELIDSESETEAQFPTKPAPAPQPNDPVAPDVCKKAADTAATQQSLPDNTSPVGSGVCVVPQTSIYAPQFNFGKVRGAGRTTSLTNGATPVLSASTTGDKGDAAHLLHSTQSAAPNVVPSGNSGAAQRLGAASQISSTASNIAAGAAASPPVWLADRSSAALTSSSFMSEASGLHLKLPTGAAGAKPQNAAVVSPSAVGAQPPIDKTSDDDFFGTGSPKSPLATPSSPTSVLPGARNAPAAGAKDRPAALPQGATAAKVGESITLKSPTAPKPIILNDNPPFPPKLPAAASITAKESSLLFPKQTLIPNPTDSRSEPKPGSASSGAYVPTILSKHPDSEARQPQRQQPGTTTQQKAIKSFF